ncbi:hypothetical protein D3C79_677590 [compost metagenome]
MPLLLPGQIVSLLFQHVELQAVERTAQLVLLAARQAIEIGQRLFRRLTLIDIHQAAHRTAVTRLQPQRLLIITFRSGVIFTRHRNVTQAERRTAVAAVNLARLLVFLLRQCQIAGFQRLVAFVNRQPVSVALNQALPFAAVIATFIGLQRLTEQAQRLWAITGA